MYIQSAAFDEAALHDAPPQRVGWGEIRERQSLSQGILLVTVMKPVGAGSRRFSGFLDITPRSFPMSGITLLPGVGTIEFGFGVKEMTLVLVVLIAVVAVAVDTDIDALPWKTSPLM
jgi:hypothetical protein